MKPPRLPSRADWLAILALLALDLSAYGLLLDPARMLVDYDALVYFYPLRAYAAMAVQEGRLPLWNPYSFLGAPFLANPQTALFYPLTAVFFWLAVPHAYGVSLFLHVLLAGIGFYALCRVSLGTRPVAALIGAMAFMLSGAISGQYGHLNQVSAVGWMPWILLLGDLAVRRRSARLAVGAGVVLGLQLLAGHPQQSYITLIAVGLFGLWRSWAAGPREMGRALMLLGLATGIGVGLSAIQLVPTAELASISIRGGGLSYREAVAGSLWPWLLARALLPGSAGVLGSTEYLGYVGVIPLLLAGVALGAADWRRSSLGFTLAGLGLALALGAANPIYAALHAVVPGFSSFRVPARWLLLYTSGAALLAAIGTDWLLRQGGRGLREAQWQRLIATLAGLLLALLAFYFAGDRVPRQLQLGWAVAALLGVVLAVGCGRPRAAPFAGLALVAAVGVELWLAGGGLPPRSPAPMEAYAQPRDSTLFVQSQLEGDRFLSVATEEYELKETPDYRNRYAHLSEDALLGLLIAAKRNEALTPNLNLLYRIPSIDGYDGGLLPLQRYLDLARLLVPEERLRSDGVLISRLDSLPPPRLMDLLNVRVVLASRAKDHLVDGLRHDGAIAVDLRPGERLDLARVPQRAFSKLAMTSSLKGAVPVEGSVIGELEVVTGESEVTRSPIVVGRHTAAAQAAETREQVELEELRPWSWAQQGDPIEFLAELPLPDGELNRMTIVNLSTDTTLQVRALTLIDERDGAVSSLVLDDRIERTEFFDMKVYEYPDVLPRAYLVHQAVEANDDEALLRLRDPEFEPGQSAVVAPGAGLHLGPAAGGESVRIEEYAPEQVQIRAYSASPALLVLSDSHATGWRVTVDGQPARLLRVNIALRGVALPAGEHEVVFQYETGSLRIGGLISAVVGLVVLVALVGLPRRLDGLRWPRRGAQD